MSWKYEVLGSVRDLEICTVQPLALWTPPSLDIDSYVAKSTPRYVQEGGFASGWRSSEIYRDQVSSE